MMLKIRGISNAENLLTGVNRFGHCLTSLEKGTSYIVPVKREIQNILSFVKTASYKTVLILGTLLL